MKNVKLKARLFGAFGIIVAAIAVSGVYALGGLGRVKSDAHVIVADNLPGIYSVGELRRLTANNLSRAKEAVAITDAGKLAKLNEAVRQTSAEITETMKDYEKSITTEADRALFRAVTEARAPFTQHRNKVFALVEEKRNAEAENELETNAVPTFDTYQAALKALSDFNKDHADKQAVAINETLGTVSAATKVGIGVASLIAIIVALLVSGSVTKPVNALLGHVDRVGRGDLESRCEYDGRDEIGVLATQMNKMTEDLNSARVAERTKAEQDKQEKAELQHKVDALLGAVKDIGAGDLTRDIPVRGTDAVGQLGEGLARLVEDLNRNMRAIAGNAHTLAASGEQLTASSQQMAANCEETSAQAATVSAASEQLSKNVQTVAAATEQMSASIKEIASSAQQATRVVSSAVQIADKTGETIAKLGTSSAEIGKVIELITSIAAQTNLLALNATIEAARAGEAGKGFAVVANEVKELAKETAKATDDIGSRIGAIQADTANATKAIDEIRTVINQVSELSLTIASAVEEQTTTTNEIGRNVSEAAKGTGDIASNITGVAQAAQSTATGATETQAAADSLGKMAAELQALVQRFRLSDDAGAVHLGPSHASHALTKPRLQSRGCAARA